MAHSHKIKNVFQKINRAMEHLIPVTTPLAIVLGILLPSVFIHMRPYVPWLFGVMTFSGALKLRAAEFGETIRRPSPILLYFVSSHLLMPVAAILVTSLVFTDQDLIAGFVLLFSGPTAVSGFIWVSIFKGDKALCLTLILLDTILAPLVVPGTVSILMGTKTTMDMSGIAISLLFMVVVPTIIGVILNEASRQRLPVMVSPYLDPGAKVCLMLVIAANAAAVAPGVRLDDPLIWKTALVVILLTIAGFSIVKLVSVIGKCRAEKGITMIISGGLRNNSAVMTIAVTFFPEAAALPTLLSIVFQQTIAALMGRLFVGRKSEERKVKNEK